MHKWRFGYFHLILYTLHQKNHPKRRFFLLNSKKCITFAVEMIHAGACGRVCLPFTLTRIFQRHNKRRHKRSVLGYLESRKFSQHPTHCSILMSSGYVYLSPYTLRWCVCVRTYRRGLRCCLFRC